MPNLDLCYTPAIELLRRYHAGEISPVEVVENSLARIAEVNPALNCFCFTYPEDALAAAKTAEQRLASGKAGPLEGIPLAIKDFTPTRGKVTTRGSRLLENWVPERSAVIVERLEAAGAIMVGKTTTPEFATSGFTDSPLWGITRNPWKRAPRAVPRAALAPRSRPAACRSPRVPTWAAAYASRLRCAASSA